MSALAELVGAELGTTGWIEVTQERIDAFAAATDDPQWIHVDPERAAAESPFGGTIAHGFLTLSMIPYLSAHSDLPKVDGVKMGVNYGGNKTRFLTPVPVGSRLRGSIEVGEVKRVPNGGAQVTWNVTVELEGSDKPACYAEAISVMYT